MIAVLITPIKPRKVTALPVKFRVSGFISVIVVCVQVLIHIELLIFEFGNVKVEDFTLTVGNLRPEFIKHLACLSGTNVVWHESGTLGGFVCHLGNWHSLNYLR